MSTLNDRVFLRRLLLLFVGFTVICVMAGASRLSTAGWNLSRCADILRVRDMLSMFVFAPVISVFFWLFYRCLCRGCKSPIMDVICILAIWAIACGMGIHDPVNCLNGVYRNQLASCSELKESVRFIDDELGHWVFWSGFVLGTWCVGIRQMLSPLDESMDCFWITLFSVVSVVLMGVMLTNLWDEYPKTKADLVVIAVAVGMLIPFHLSLAGKVSVMRMPVTYVIYLAYAGSIAGTLVCWQFRYGIFF